MDIALRQLLLDCLELVRRQPRTPFTVSLDQRLGDTLYEAEARHPARRQGARARHARQEDHQEQI